MSISTIMGVPIANIAEINGIPIANISKWNGETITTPADVPFTMEYIIPSDSLSLTLPLNSGNGSTFNCTVDWGDSSSSTITAVDDADRVHTYASAGTYEVKITGICEGWRFNNGGDKLKLTKIKSFGKGSSFAGFKYLLGGFDGCTNLTTLGIDPIKPSGTGVIDFYHCFYNCISLTTMPSDLFRYNTAATNFIYCFYNCISLTTMPSDLFRYNTAATDFFSCFYNCTSLTTMPSDLFRYNTAATYFASCFYNCISLTLRADIFYPSGEQLTRFLNKTVYFSYCFYRNTFTGTQGIAPDLWNCDFGTGEPNKTSCFGGVGNNTTSISNYASIPADWK